MEPHLPARALSRLPDAEDLPGPAARRAARAGLYVHVPFCATRCHYCDFSSGPISRLAVERYLAGLEREAELRAGSADGLSFSSVFLGGGTPSLLSADRFRRLWQALASRFAIDRDAEITLEANPESVSAPRAAAWAECGVNRLSLGAQSFDDGELERLGRIHRAERLVEAVAVARAQGYRRLSLDLMFGFPWHERGRWRRTLERALALDPGHLSAYCFIPEPGTPLGEAVLRGEEVLPSDEEQAESYEELMARGAAAGYGGYETSNLCRPGEEARHNLVYWLRRPYVGLGPSAHGLAGGERYGNHYSLARWASALERGEPPEEERETVRPEDVAREVLLLGLRLGSGVRREDHIPAVWEMVAARYGSAWERGLATGRLERAGDGVRIPPALRFVADDVIAWVDAEADRASFDRLSAGSVTSHPCQKWPSPAA